MQIPLTFFKGFKHRVNINKGGLNQQIYLSKYRVQNVILNLTINCLKFAPILNLRYLVTSEKLRIKGRSNKFFFI